MQVFSWVALLIVATAALFAIQNSSAPPVTVKFLIWKFETSLVYTILGSIGLGILLPVLLWVPRAIRESLRKRDVNNGA
jgi:lipopolysaccharide assembly protein A